MGQKEEQTRGGARLGGSLFARRGGTIHVQNLLGSSPSLFMCRFSGSQSVKFMDVEENEECGNLNAERGRWMGGGWVEGERKEKEEP